MPKLYIARWCDYVGREHKQLVVGKTEKEARGRAMDQIPYHFFAMSLQEVDEVDGYRIVCVKETEVRQ